ncbi:MAG: gamma carbonic anhydrase family protein [Candidatus Cloacimonetes bacterium]|nr:gamma carbonic anhydrase family protein [Candidatus Cloacimonadota bacterium]MCF7812957.1 gamma carbonic anhydrase family protein [Candidatus Cloacimonadota bacterium]MCF7867311.1 gamma carbonic anhydrase family protein [Candidatus Cloacimonadota bacterium]MCF7882755.1 gamma carbonic anhydrase family protein [Candidatus Cloacimonadota bacterium]
MISKFKEYEPELGKKVFVAKTAEIIGMCEIGEDSSVWFGAVIRGDIHYIKIGERTSIQDLSMIHVTRFTKKDMSDGFPVKIGNDVTVGHKAMLHGCTVEDACLIGMSATLLDGCRIGTESIVAAGAVVPPNKTYPPRSLIMGVPAKVVRQLSDEDVQGIYQSAQHYVNFKNDYLNLEK